MNTRKIEPGMLCMVVGTRNAGRECTTIRVVSYGDTATEFNSHGRGGNVGRSGWLVHGPSITSRNTLFGEAYLKGYAIHTDDELMPLNPDNKLTMTEIKKIKVPNAPVATV